jgi:hypothetical protein
MINGEDIFKPVTQSAPETKPEVIPEPKKDVETQIPVPVVPITIVSTKPSWKCC